MSMTLHDSLEIGNVFGSEAGFMEAKILQERYIIRDKCLRKGLPSSHNTNCKDFGSAFRSRGRNSSNETAQRGRFETCLAPGTNTRLGIRRAVNNKQVKY